MNELLARTGDLLYLCESLSELESMLLLYISLLDDFSAQYQRFRQEVARPYLLPWYPFPERNGADLVRTDRGHAGPVTHCALSSDGAAIVSASTDTTLNVWNIASGALRLTLRGHTAALTGCAITPDGSRIISTSEDDTIRIWNAYSGSELLVLAEHQSAVTGCALSPDERWMLSASVDDSLKGWLTKQDTDIFILLGHADSVYHCAINAQGDRVVSASADHTLKIWSVPAITTERLPDEEEFAFAWLRYRSIREWGCFSGRTWRIETLEFAPDRGPKSTL